MAGSQCHNALITRKEFNPRASKAFCEGMAARMESIVLDNPYPEGTRENVEWQAGATRVNTEAGNTITDRGFFLCCSIELGTVPNA